ncbi:uncharacterized protein LOC120140901 isoform X2 [Hibiscus syriacus]|uniref:uncharacterized protein LOC120140901 isoform X2 n=1 Tax=Hibiscus syriacus TaxID=106335 RepID=UPI0019209E8B|nr:uncharacterized protein LOC120140901 isoform X2 [Hibiscus syriacus]
MAADQRRKRLHGASIAGCNSLDRYKTKKKRLEPPRNDLKTKCYISLEWDGNKKEVVAKREQIGLSRRHSRSFTDSTDHYHRVLADVLTLPHEVFELKDLTKVLSYEVWQSHLSENERNFLMQFLPKGIDKEQVLQALFSGDNFHFGNHFLQWGISLCSGHLHPDTIIQEEQRLKAEKKAYYSELQDYHNDIVENLKKLKEKWESCKYPEQEIVQKLWRSKRVCKKRVFSHSRESRLGNVEQDVTATSESCSWVADEKASSSDNQNSSVVKDGKIRRSLYEKGTVKEKGRMLSTTPDYAPTVEARPKKGDKIRKRNIQQCDGTKYMSCFKISKKQHDLLKNMEQSGRSIESKSIIRVLGDIYTLHVQPYEVFIEEEQRKLHERWLKLVKEDIPESYANWREIQLQKWKMTKSLEQEMKEKPNSLLEDQEDDVDTHSAALDVEEEDPEKDTEATESESSMEDGESGLALPLNQSPQKISSIDSGQLCNHVESENENISKPDVASSDESEHSDDLNTAGATVSQEVPVSSVEIVWSADSMPHSYHDSTADHKYTSTSGLPFIHQDTEDQNQMTDLESDLRKGSNGKALLHSHSEDGPFSYTNQDRNELLQLFFKDQGVSSYHSEQKQVGADFHPPKNLLMEDDHFNGQFPEQLQSSLLLEQRQKRQNEVYMPQNIFSAGGGSLTPRREHLPLGNMQDWTIPPAPMPAPFHHQLNSRDMLNQNWFTGEHQVSSGWAGSEGFSGQNPNILSASNADQSLFSVLSHSNQFHSRIPYETMGSTEQFIPQRNNGMMRGSTPGIVGNSMQQAAHPLDFLGSCDTTTPLMVTDDTGWMNLTHQNSALHDPMGKPYLRSWNQ